MDEHLLDAIAATRRAIAEFEAVEAGLYAIALDGALRSAAPGSSADMPVRAVAAEIGAAVLVSDRVIQRRLDEAHRLTTRFPTTYAAFCEGRISSAHVSEIVGAGTRIDDDHVRAGYEEMAVAVAERESAGRLRGIARLLAEKVLPRPMGERHADAAAQRGVWVTDLDDGMSELRALLPSVLAHGILDRLTRMGRASREDVPCDRMTTSAAGVIEVSGSDDESADGPTAEAEEHDPVDRRRDRGPWTSAGERSIPQMRADLLADLVLTGSPSCDPSGVLDAIHAEVLVTVPVLTLADRHQLDGSAPAPAMLDGATPIDPHTARRLAGEAAGWDRVLTHPVTGGVLVVDRYRPSADLRRFLRAADQRCRFPCCRLPAHRCDVDHLEDAARGGPTVQHNLGSECRRHHVLKHAAGWTVVKAQDGVVTWTSPAGRVYPDHPPGVVFRTRPDPLAIGGGGDAPF